EQRHLVLAHQGRAATFDLEGRQRAQPDPVRGELRGQGRGAQGRGGEGRGGEGRGGEGRGHRRTSRVVPAIRTFSVPRSSGGVGGGGAAGRRGGGGGGRGPVVGVAGAVAGHRGVEVRGQAQGVLHDHLPQPVDPPVERLEPGGGALELVRGAEVVHEVPVQGA